jgi:hypothetical protein
MKNLKQKLFALAVIGISTPAFAEGAITDAISNGKLIVIGLAGLLIAVAALTGVWLIYTGVTAMLKNGNSQDTPAQSIGKVIGGVVLVAMMAFLGSLLNELGIESSSSSAINSEVFSSQGG